MHLHRVLLVVNPVARTVSKPTLAVIEKALSADFRLEVIETKERGHANEIAAQAVAEGVDLVVVFSGDGTINEVLNALAGSEVALGVIPGGATNILVRALGIPTDPVEATGVLIGRALDDDAFKLHLGRADGTVLRRQLRRRCGRGRDGSHGREVPQDEGQVRSGGVPLGVLGVAGWLRGSRTGPAGLGGRPGGDPVAVRHGGTHRSRTPITRTEDSA